MVPRASPNGVIGGLLRTNCPSSSASSSCSPFASGGGPANPVGSAECRCDEPPVDRRRIRHPRIKRLHILLGVKDRVSVGVHAIGILVKQSDPGPPTKV